jgi:hypothetical protein
VLVALGLLVSMSTFLERSADLRVDMLTAIAGLACLLLLLERRFALAGFAAGLGFLFSQKGIYYVVSANAGLASWWLLGRFPKAALRATLVLNAAIAALVLVYVLVWSAVADIGSVVRAVFLSPAGVALADPYSIQLRFWAQTVVRNPAFYGLVPAAMLYLLLDRGRRDDPAPTLLLGFGATLLALCLWHKQPWPYFFVLLLPTLFVIHVAFLDGLARTELMGGGLRRSGLVALVALGVLYPLGRVRVNLSRDNGLQRLSVRLVEAVLEPGDTYLAAVSLVPSNDQAVASLTWLDRPRLTRLQNLPAGALQSLADSLRQDPPKLYVQNYRTQQLPAPLTDFLRATYTHLWGNVFTYAPPVQEGLGICPLAFTGRYSVGAVEDERAVRVRIAGRVLAAGDTVTLVRGSPACSVEGPARLVLSPTEVEPLRDPRFREPGEFFPNVYGY